MAKILDDIIDKTNSVSTLKTILKWVAGSVVTVAVGAYGYGQFKTNKVYKEKELRDAIIETNEKIDELQETTNNGFIVLNKKIEKIYVDGFDAFEDYQKFNKKQLEIIVDYGQTNKDLVKKMLDINMTEKISQMENYVELNKNTQLNNEVKKQEYDVIMHAVSGKDTTFVVRGATQKYIDGINEDYYNVEQITKNKDNPRLNDIIYKTK
jgi:hypothetical protein